MAFTMPQFGNATNQQLNPMADLIKNAMAGYQGGVQTRYAAPTAEQDLLAKILATKKSEAELPYAGELAKATTAYKIAMANYLSSPNQALKYMSNIGKTYVEPGIVNAILQSRGVRNTQPNQGFQYSPPEMNQNQNNQNNVYEQQNDNSGSINDTYALGRQKLTSDSQARNRNLFATNIEKTLSYIDPKALTQYGGSIGSLEKLAQTGLSSIGTESKNYDNYRTSLNAVKLLTKQIRQFYGDSIQPSMQENLEALNNPATWAVNPKLAERLFKQTTNILKNELGTYRSALKNPKTYQETGTYNNSQNSSPPSEEDIEYTAKKYNMPVEQVKSMMGIK